MHDLEPAAEIGVLVADGVEAVRAGRHDASDLRFVQRLDVLLGEGLECVLVAHPARGVARARFAWAEDREVDSGGEKELGRRDSALPGALVKGGCTADPEENVWRGIA